MSNLERLRELLSRIERGTSGMPPAAIAERVVMMTAELAELRVQLAALVTVEEQSEVRRAQILALLNHAFPALVGMDGAGCITLWNQAATQLFGWASSEVVGANLAEVMIPERYRARHRNGLASVPGRLEHSYFYQVLAMPALTKAGHELLVHMMIGLVESDAGLHFLAVIWDPTAPPPAAHHIDEMMAARNGR